MHPQNMVVQALRSGEYKQGSMAWRTLKLKGTESTEFFCAVGVMLDVWMKDSCRAQWKVNRSIAPDGIFTSTITTYAPDTMMDRSAYEWNVFAAWLEIPKAEFKEFIRLNDQEGRSFTFIADLIEKRYIRPRELAETIATSDLATWVDDMVADHFDELGEPVPDAVEDTSLVLV